VSLLRRLPGYRRAPAGLEWAVLRRLPGVTLAGTFVPVAAALFVTLYAGDDPAGERLVTTTWIVVASALVLHWTAMFTLALACAIVWIAKGPAYVADAYELIDADRPAPARQPASPHRPDQSARAGGA
jgi:hypothetical protein